MTPCFIILLIIFLLVIVAFIAIAIAILAPHPKNNKERIAFDIVWWPMSILSMALSDLPEHIWNTINRFVSGTYQMINGWIFGSAKI